MAVAVEPQQTAFIDRQTLCLAGSTPGLATHAGEDDFAQRLRKNYQADESNVAEQLIYFKNELNKLDGEAFWSRLMTGMTEICHSQFAFVSKRVLIDDQDTAVEMPRIGEHGSCLMATALYYNNGEAIKGLHHDYKYHAWSCPCAHMKHDKVFLIADHLCDFIQNNPNQVPFEPEAYLAVPLFAEGKCFAHFGMMWTKEGIRQKSKLSWAFIELFMHALEDMITKKLLIGQSFAKSAEQLQEKSRVIPQTAVTATQSLKVYARSLSHELRTPMQGVVGMLDLMYATVQEQIESEENQNIRKVFQSLRNSIEVVQDSSKRAIEAADNVVHAYDLNMQVPETPSAESDTISASMGSYFDTKPNMTDGTRIVNPHKRKRSHGSAQDYRGFNKFRNTLPTPQMDPMPLQSPLRNTCASGDVSPRRRSPPLFSERITLPDSSRFMLSDIDTPMLTPGNRHSIIRDILPIVINDSLRVGGRPDTAVTEPTALGERIEVRTRSSDGQSSFKLVQWSVQPDVPYMIPIDERDFSKLVGAVFLNALKFTDDGEIEISVRLSESKRSVLIDVKDTGTGIPEAFQPELFKAFSKEDDSITRHREGLGLGLMVAKGLARRLGGDLDLVRTAVAGPNHGSEFEIRVPIEAGASSSRATTPSRMTREASVPRSVPPTATHDARQAHRTSPLMREQSPLEPASPSRVNMTPKLERQQNKPIESAKSTAPPIQRRISIAPRNNAKPDRQLAQKYPLSFLVAEDNKINRKLLVQMLNTLGYKDVHEAYDGKEAVRVVQMLVDERRVKKRQNSSARTQGPVDVILMDLWMPEMDGYQATEQIFNMFRTSTETGAIVSAVGTPPTVLAVSADVTDEAIDRATKIGMAGYMSKPFKVLDLQKLILEFCVGRSGVV
ncbi:hypothetical protein PMZ80_004231 [Knufia obscura]|uniref:histidine kinase n=2 Tax=Knufia TaxID=430999 RepID=A0AAN8E864_9EURO|nr:hypothetical protein PMZ80_004231 [Knufia obscura]KAK5948644.1 hypothetical protein OHC33_010246 [Knufia fluminis]